MCRFFTLAILIILFSFTLEANTSSGNLVTQNTPDIALVTIAKSGTNLSLKLIQEISEVKSGYSPTTVEAVKLTNNSFCNTHFQHKHVFDFILKNPSFKKIVINIRDPRDVLVSAAFFYPRLPVFDDGLPNCGRLIGKKFSTLSIKDRLKLFLLPPEGFTSTPIYDIKAACDFLANNYNKERFFLIRYEDLIHKDLQSETTCSELAWFLGYSYSSEFLQDILDKSIGESPTFRRGKTGDWKQYFDEELKTIFKAVLGDELIFLGYEIDYNW
jgi:sulfotransferase 6B1